MEHYCSSLSKRCATLEHSLHQLQHGQHQEFRPRSQSAPNSAPQPALLPQREYHVTVTSPSRGTSTASVAAEEGLALRDQQLGAEQQLLRSARHSIAGSLVAEAGSAQEGPKPSKQREARRSTADSGSGNWRIGAAQPESAVPLSSRQVLPVLCCTADMGRQYLTMLR